MAIKSDLVRALKIHKERTDEAIAERIRLIASIQYQLSELYRIIADDLSNVAGVELIRTEEPYALNGATLELQSLKILLAGQTVSFRPELRNAALEVMVSNLCVEPPILKVRNEHGQWIATTTEDAFVSQFSSDFFLTHLVDLVDRS